MYGRGRTSCPFGDGKGHFPQLLTDPMAGGSLLNVIRYIGSAFKKFMGDPAAWPSG